MSGLDGLGWPNPEDEPKQNKTMNSQLEIKLAPTPETDAAYTQLPDEGVWDFKVRQEKTMCRLERERDELREWASVNGVSSLAKDRDQFRARLREEQQLHVQTLNERDEARETCSELVTDSDAITLARTVVRITQDRDEARGQRDRLAAALRKLADCDWVITPHDRMDAVREIARKALQSLTPNEKQ